jgi:DGQHR domain-containing protein
MELAALRITQNSKAMFLVELTAKQVRDNKILPDIWSSSNQTGYQRELDHSRSRKFSKYIQKSQNISPNSVLLSVRQELKFVPKDGDYGRLVIPDNTEIHVVDGQHRIDGLKLALKEAPTLSFTIPAIIISPQMMGAKSTDDATYLEAKQFVVINQTQKRVRADLSDRFVQRLTSDQRQELEVLGRPEKLERKKIAINIVDLLRERDGSPWYKNIKLPTGGSGIVSETTFKRQLEDLLENPPFKTMSDEEIADVLDDYWSAWRDLCPSAFDEPEKYVLQKSTGVSVLHMLLEDVVRWIGNTQKEYTKENFFEVLNHMTLGVTDTYWSSGGDAGKLGSGYKVYNELYSSLRDNFLASNVRALKESSAS